MARSRTFFAQGTHVLPLPGRPGEFLFMADRWIPTDLGKSRRALSWWTALTLKALYHQNP